MVSFLKIWSSKQILWKKRQKQYHSTCLEHYIFKEDNIKKHKTLHQQYEALLFN